MRTQRPRADSPYTQALGCPLPRASLALINRFTHSLSRTEVTDPAARHVYKVGDWSINKRLTVVASYIQPCVSTATYNAPISREIDVARAVETVRNKVGVDTIVKKHYRNIQVLGPGAPYVVSEVPNNGAGFEICFVNMGRTKLFFTVISHDSVRKAVMTMSTYDMMSRYVRPPHALVRSESSYKLQKLSTLLRYGESTATGGCLTPP